MNSTVNVFPTRVGMNRGDRLFMNRLQGVPHARGDEPHSARYCGYGSPVFPTRVGMNRCRRNPHADAGRVPHARGDEPKAAESLERQLKCSPRAWG